MNLLASAIKSATYEDVQDLAKWIVDAGGLNHDYQGFGDPLMTKEDVSEALLDWANASLKSEALK